nr:MAG TPA: hypothetical protein [Caudoviricetes sp.]
MFCGVSVPDVIALKFAPSNKATGAKSKAAVPADALYNGKVLFHLKMRFLNQIVTGF